LPKDLFAEFLFAEIFICGIFISQIAETQFGLIYNTGTNVMFLKNIFAKNFGKKNWRFGLKTKKNAIFLPKFLAKIT
jgi:hypothetical protein